MDKKLLKKFPNLAKEMESSKMKLKIDSIRSNVEVGETAPSEKFKGYAPDIIDFLRRCDSKEEAIGILEFMENRGEISGTYANNLRRQLKREGLRSFGKKKASNYYLRKWKP